MDRIAAKQESQFWNELAGKIVNAVSQPLKVEDAKILMLAIAEVLETRAADIIDGFPYEGDYVQIPNRRAIDTEGAEPRRLLLGGGKRRITRVIERGMGAYFVTVEGEEEEFSWSHLMAFKKGGDHPWAYEDGDSEWFNRPIAKLIEPERREAPRDTRTLAEQMWDQIQKRAEQIRAERDAAA